MGHTEISAATVITRNDKQYIANMMGEEMVMMDMERGDYLVVNTVGTDIWNLSASPISIQQLADKLVEIYNVPVEQCLAETLNFVNMHSARELFILS